jgi:hypothetical protein
MYDSFRGPIESGIAVKQLEDDAITYAVAKETSQGIIKTTISALTATILIVIWFKPFCARIKFLSKNIKEIIR